MKSNKLKWNLFVFVLYVILIIASFKLVFGIAPSSTEVTSFLKENSCNPSATETDSDDEHECAYYLRRHTATIFGQIVNSGFPLFVTNPFGYFHYDLTASDTSEIGCALTDSCRNDDHVYVFVVTRDKDALVYNPVNGKYIGSYNSLMSKLGCEFRENHNSVFFSQRFKTDLGVETTLCEMNFIKQAMTELEAMEKLKEEDEEIQKAQYIDSENYEYDYLYGADYNSSEDLNNKYDCADFDTHAEAQKVFERDGGPSYDPHHLDRDADGIACETLP